MLRAAELGNRYAIAGAWNQLLFVGKPEDRDTRLGLHFLIKGANADDPNSAYMLGREYLTGRDVPRDPARAAQWFVRAAKGKHALASLWLSELHAKGLGVPRNRKGAEEMLETALRDASIRDKNNFSWTLSVTPDAQLRNAALAIRVLEPRWRRRKRSRPLISTRSRPRTRSTVDSTRRSPRSSKPSRSATRPPRRPSVIPAATARAVSHGKSYREETL